MDSWVLRTLSMPLLSSVVRIVQLNSPAAHETRRRQGAIMSPSLTSGALPSDVPVPFIDEGYVCFGESNSMMLGESAMKKALLTGGLILVALVLGGCIMICCDDTGPDPNTEVACAAACELAPEQGAAPAEP